MMVTESHRLDGVSRRMYTRRVRHGVADGVAEFFTRLYAPAEIERALREAGFREVTFFEVTRASLPSQIYLVAGI